MASDKKRRHGRLRWILPRAIGEVEIAEDVPAEVVLEALRRTRLAT
jgi:3-dehydroquinate synthetase